MASQAEIDRRKTILRARGVPERFVDNIARRRGPLLLQFSMPALILGLIASAIALIAYAGPIDEAVAPLLYTLSRDSLLFSLKHSPGTTPILAMMGIGVPAGFWLMLFFNLRKPQPFPAYNNIAHRLRSLAYNEKLDELKPWDRYADLADLPDDQAFLTAFHTPMFRLWPIAGLQLILAAVMGLTLWFGVLTAFTPGPYQEVTRDTVRIYDGQRTRIYRLADADYAYVICYNDRAANIFDYRLHYPDRTIALSTFSDPMHRLSREQIIERLGQIDDRLQQLHVRTDRMPMEGRFRDSAIICANATGREWSPRGRKTLLHLVFGT